MDSSIKEKVSFLYDDCSLLFHDNLLKQSPYFHGLLRDPLPTRNNDQTANQQIREARRTLLH